MQMAGFLSLLSNEVSTFLLSIIMLDRILVIHGPFSNRRLGFKSTSTLCVFLWCCGIALAALPLTSILSHRSMYGQTGLCTLLPFSKTKFETVSFAFDLIILNFVLSSFIIFGQISIIIKVKESPSSNFHLQNVNEMNTMDVKVAKRMFSPTLVNFVCWVSVALLGLLDQQELVMPEELNVAVVTVLLPFKAVLNPCLDAVNVALEQRKDQRQKEFIRSVENRLRLGVGQKARKGDPSVALQTDPLS